jgi:hypothetical protein
MGMNRNHPTWHHFARVARTDLHHPRVCRSAWGTWTWRCGCGGASRRAASCPFTWHEAFAGALYHALSVAA